MTMFYPRALTIRRHVATLLLGGLLLSGCQSNPYTSRLHKMARQAMLSYHLLPGVTFDLASWQRTETPGAVLHLYVESSGFVQQGGGQLSQDPTPHHPMAFYLAAVDPHPNVAYLARPCQYVLENPQQRRNCAPRYWSSHALDDVVMADLLRATDWLQHAAGATQIHLIGVGSGASAAAWLSAKRPAVTRFLSVDGIFTPQAAPPLELPPPSELPPSLSTMEAFNLLAQQLASVPQRHYITGLDHTLSSNHIQPFIITMGRHACAHVALHRYADLNQLLKHWPSLLTEPLHCADRS
ncbi:hypothetical protein Mmc1_0409 [Magnetococcus marinus MC-1]|uniref:Uncharacterized protein n=1 Tax=Magnetococcus marinus (strain ATCC BAA-1437 / JCM 17883 / MC-1) TaxID=156889 RepID=A0L4P2_MAGMM|nr:hypothetical protein [Magnetococcus marinus]ABK42935.1 hypothetical protein Mmc1_0409 [Magnetococcus marinus MC-1]